MKQQEVFKKIGIIIKELNDQYEYLVNNETELNDLELELFVANAHFLADHSEVLRKLNQQAAHAPKPTPKPEEKFFEPVVQQSTPRPAEEQHSVKDGLTELLPDAIATQAAADEAPVPHIDLRGDDTGTDYSYIRQEPEVIRHELSADEEKEEPIKPAEQPKAEIKAEPPVVIVKEEPVREIPRVEPKVEENEEPLTINQRISAQLNKTASRAAEHAQPQSITDLKQAITLNDKLLYIKDLFNGYNLAYSEAIDILNRYNSFDEADKFLKSNYATKNNWESKQATVDKFYALLERRYA